MALPDTESLDIIGMGLPVTFPVSLTTSPVVDTGLLDLIGLALPVIYIYVVVAPGGGAYTLSLSDTVSSSDSLRKHIAKSFSDTKSSVESFYKLISRSFSDSVSTNDINAEVVLIRLVNLNDSISSLDWIKRDTTKVFSETIVSLETLRKMLARSFVEVSDPEDDIDLAHLPGLVLSETVTSTDWIKRDVSKTMVDSILAVDALLKYKIQYRELNDSVESVEDFSYIKLMSVVLSDTITTIDVILKGISKSFRETVTSLDPKIKRVLNGVTLIWSPIAKILSTIWTKIAKPTDTIWTKKAKPSPDTIWTKIPKP